MFATAEGALVSPSLSLAGRLLLASIAEVAMDALYRQSEHRDGDQSENRRDRDRFDSL
jgi:hypothetical protein